MFAFAIHWETSSEAREGYCIKYTSIVYGDGEKGMSFPPALSYSSGLSGGNIEISFWSRSDTTAGAVKGMSSPYNVTFARQFPEDRRSV